MARFPFYKQIDYMDCGPACLRMIIKFFGKTVSIQRLKDISETTRSGSSLLKISNAAEKLGFRTLGVKINYTELNEKAPFPCILHWNQNHFVVLYKIKKGKAYIADPAVGLRKIDQDELIRSWIGEGANEHTKKGIALLLEPTVAFQNEELDEKEEKYDFSFLFKYIAKYKTYLTQLAVGLLLGSMLQLIFPFLTQSIVDIGIQNNDIDFIYIILIAQLFLYLGSTSVEFIRSWILLHLSTRINISLISDFFIKLMKLPISFFDSKMTGDIMQRINDHQRIEKLLTVSSLSIIFSIFNLIIFSFVLGYYSIKILLLFLGASAIYFGWVMFFLKRRKQLDHMRFSQSSVERSKVIELINGMQEIKLNNAEKQKRWGWESVQIKLFKIRVKSLVLNQTQSTGSLFINEIKNLLITVFSAKLVIDGQITLGMLLAISYIIGQLNSPIQQMISFIYSLQDAKIALERVGEIYNREDEEPEGTSAAYDLDEARDIIIKNLSFRYLGTTASVLKNIDLTIEKNKITAIVGASGSGKTTLLKMILKYYQAEEGEIKLNNINLQNVSPEQWRGVCGIVMQDGYIFNDTVASNISLGTLDIDLDRMRKAMDIANIKDFVEDLPQGLNTKIGMEGMGMSAGQKQRILIARAIYKNPRYVFFDEATSALDAKNEVEIMNKLQDFLAGRTSIIIAHRLSTVKNADMIIVMNNGGIVETGTHEELVEARGRYYELVKNQLNLEKISVSEIS